MSSGRKEGKKEKKEGRREGGQKERRKEGRKEGKKREMSEQMEVRTDKERFSCLPRVHCFAVPIMAQQKWIQLVSVRIRVWSLASLSGLRVWCCHELWYRSQMGLISGIAVAVVQQQLQLQFNPWPGNLHMPWVTALGNKKKKKKKSTLLFLTVLLPIRKTMTHWDQKLPNLRKR